MRPKVLEISWHETQAVYSCDFQPLPPAQLKRLLSASTADEDDKDKAASAAGVAAGVPAAAAGGAGGRQYRLATAGGDSKVRLWMIHPNIPSVSPATHAALTGQEVVPHPPRAEYLATLSKHTAAVNVVRFSPNGQMLASAGDDGNVILWVPSDRPGVTFGETSDDLPDKEHWRLQKMLQVTTKHVYDLSWSPDSEFLIAGSTDNTATIWKAATGECVFALREHTHNVQGVSWDPLNEYIATQSSDRSVHVNTFAFRNGVPDVHPVSRATRMEIRHSRTPSIPSGTRPNMVRRGSTTSEAGSVITTASDFPEGPAPALPAAAHAVAPATPSASVPSTPQPPQALMNPPPTSNRPGSRRSSFSGSQAAGSPSLSASAFSRAGRSPSPIPPLPAIRAPPATLINQRIYGEEGVTRFFRRLTFSPDGSLLLTPAGQIEDQIFRGSPRLSARSLSQDGLDAISAIPVPAPASTSAAASGTSGNAVSSRPKNIDAGKPTVYIYSRANLARAPIAHLPGHKTASVAIRFSPVFYDLRTGAHAQAHGHQEPKHVTLDRAESQPVHVSLSMPPPPPPSKDGKDGEKHGEKAAGEKSGEKHLGSVFALPYRLYYAVACQDSVLLYDTQQAGPIAIFKGLHYAGFTDVAWSPDGQSLLLSSADGYCSIIVFDLGELGTVHPTQQHQRQLQAIAHSHAAISTPLHSSLHGVGSASNSATPISHSPAVSVARQSPAPGIARSERSEREGSTASSTYMPGSSFLGGQGATTSANVTPVAAAGVLKPPSSVASSSGVGGAGAGAGEQVLPTPTPSEDVEPSSSGGGGGKGIELGSGEEGGKKREGEAKEEKDEAPKKKRRVALTHLGEDQ